MKMSRKKLLYVALAAVFSIGLASCGSSSTAGKADGENVTLNWWWWGNR